MNRVNVRKNRVNVIYMGIAIILLFIVIFYHSFVSIAKSYAKPEQTYKYFQSVEIRNGDTVWSIASQYISSEYNSMEDYVNEIIKLNNLESADINAGEYIIIPYYDIL